MKALNIKAFFSAVCFVLLFVYPLQTASFKSDQTSVVLDVPERVISNGKFLRPPITFVIGSSVSLMGADFFTDEDILGNVSMWQIQVFENRGDKRKVSFIQGKGYPSSFSFPWSGFSNDGDLLPDGFYSARFIWRDSQKNFYKTPQTFFSLSAPASLKCLSGLKLRINYIAKGLLISVNEMALFKSGQFMLRKKTVKALREIIVFLKSYPENKVIVRGYTDSIGTVKSNKILSRKRAFSVYKYLVKNGINPDQLAYEGQGSDNPIASNATKEGRAKNRRVDIVILRPVV